MSNHEQDQQEQESTTTRVIKRIKHPLAKHPGEIRPEDLPGGMAPEDLPHIPGAEGGSTSKSADALPGIPSKDGAPLGSTDQHSDA